MVPRPKRESRPSSGVEPEAEARRHELARGDDRRLRDRRGRTAPCRGRARRRRRDDVGERPADVNPEPDARRHGGHAATNPRRRAGPPPALLQPARSGHSPVAVAPSLSAGTMAGGCLDHDWSAKPCIRGAAYAPWCTGHHCRIQAFRGSAARSGEARAPHPVVPPAAASSAPHPRWALASSTVAGCSPARSSLPSIEPHLQLDLLLAGEQVGRDDVGADEGLDDPGVNRSRVARPEGAAYGTLFRKSGLAAIRSRAAFAAPHSWQYRSGSWRTV